MPLLATMPEVASGGVHAKETEFAVVPVTCSLVGLAGGAAPAWPHVQVVQVEAPEPLYAATLRQDHAPVVTPLCVELLPATPTSTSCTPLLTTMPEVASGDVHAKETELAVAPVTCTFVGALGGVPAT